MENKIIVNIGKGMFSISLLLGSICLFGYIITKITQFAFYGYLFLIAGFIINLIIVIILLVYGSVNKERWKACLTAISIMLLNIPISILYAVIGLNIL